MKPNDFPLADGAPEGDLFHRSKTGGFPQPTSRKSIDKLKASGKLSELQECVYSLWESAHILKIAPCSVATLLKCCQSGIPDSMRTRITSLSSSPFPDTVRKRTSELVQKGKLKLYSDENTPGEFGFVDPDGVRRKRFDVV